MMVMVTAAAGWCTLRNRIREIALGQPVRAVLIERRVERIGLGLRAAGLFDVGLHLAFRHAAVIVGVHRREELLQRIGGAQCQRTHREGAECQRAAGGTVAGTSTAAALVDLLKLCQKIENLAAQRSRCAAGKPIGRRRIAGAYRKSRYAACSLRRRCGRLRAGQKSRKHLTRGGRRCNAHRHGGLANALRQFSSTSHAHEALAEARQEQN
jgi:hypothetical protein